MAEFPGEWNFTATITAPPSTGQMRLNAAAQASATKLWVHKTPASGGDASADLAKIKVGWEVVIANKTDPTKNQTYAVTAAPVDATSYVEYPVVWRRGNAVPEQRTTLAAASISVSVQVNPPLALRAETNTHTEVSGQLITFDFAFPWQGKNYTSPGMTLRQYYAGRAMQGFIAGSNVPAANLVGKVAAYAFTVANSLIAFEEKERLGYHMPPAGSDRNAPTAPPSPPPPEDASVLKPPLSPTMKQVWPRKIIS